MVRLMEPILARVMTSRAFGYLTSKQRAGVIQALLITLVGPRGTTDSERQSLRRRLLELPWGWELCESSCDGLVDRSQELMTRLEHPGILAALGRSIARNLGSAPVRDAVFLMMVLLFYADGGTESELGTLSPLRQAMGIPSAHESWIIDQLQLELTQRPR